MKKQQLKIEHFCGTCTNHYGEHNQGANGLILCKCIFSTEDKLLRHDSCNLHSQILKIQK